MTDPGGLIVSCLRHGAGCTLDDDVLTANVLHPGFVGSNFAREGDYGVLGTVVMPLIRPFAISSNAETAHGSR